MGIPSTKRTGWLVKNEDILIMRVKVDLQRRVTIPLVVWQQVPHKTDEIELRLVQSHDAWFILLQEPRTANAKEETSN